MKNRILYVSIIMVFILSLTASAANISFKDTEDHWAKESIYAMAEKWVILGYGDGTFKPDLNITKTHAFLMFSRIMGFNDPESDIVIEQAIENYKEILNENGITDGDSEIAYLAEKDIISLDDVIEILGNGKQNENLTRQEAAYVFVKLLDDEENLDKFPMLEFEDKKEIKEEYEAYVEYVNKMGIMIGVDGTHFDPNGSVTRAQVATILNRVDRIIYERTVDNVKGIVTKIDLIENIIEIENQNENRRYKLLNNFETYNQDKKVSRATIKANDAVTLYLNDGSVEKVVIKNTEKTVYAEFVEYTSKPNEIAKVNVQINGANMTYSLFEDATAIKNGKNINIANIVKGEKVEINLLNDKIQNIIVGAFSENKTGVINEIVIGKKSYISIENMQGEINKYAFAEEVEYDFDGAIGNIYDLRLGMEVKLTVTHNGVTKVKIETLTNVKIISGTVQQILPKIYVFTIEKDDGEIMMFFLDENETTIKTSKGTVASMADIEIGTEVSVYGRFEQDVFYPIQVIIY